MPYLKNHPHTLGLRTTICGGHEPFFARSAPRTEWLGKCCSIVKFEFSEPYISRFGKELSFAITEPVLLRELVRKWPPSLLPPTVLGQAGLLEDRLLAHFLFFRESRRIGLDDQVNDSDLIKVMLTATGG